MADYVTADTGTGLVHTAPDHGVDDFNSAHHLGLLQLVGPDGRFAPAVNDPELEGKNIFDSNPLVVERLRGLGNDPFAHRDKGFLLHEEKLQHSYPHCWRTKTPILFRATEQWFITMDDELAGSGRSLRELGLAGVDATTWVPAQGRNRIHAMIAGRPDWCISRQRAWGTPITVLRCSECSAPLVAPEVFEKAAAAIESGGIEAWPDLPVEQLKPAGAVCAQCGSAAFQKETDILDVWIDSGVSAAVVADTHPELDPADYGKFIYLEGSDQHRGWFHSSLLFNLAATGAKPYETVVTHGFVLDGKGQKMSKSLGNVVTPEDVFKTYGADILRLWVASCDYSEDVRISKEILERNADAYRKIRNTLRFLLGALGDFLPGRDARPEADWSAVDRWAWQAFGRLAGEVRAAYLRYDFLAASQALLSFCQQELSSRYFEILKDRLYCDAPGSDRRRSAQTVCWRLGRGMAVLMAPLLSFTADEFWEFLPGGEADKGGSVFEQRFPEPGPALADLDLWGRFWEIRDAVQAAMEPHRAAKAIGTGLDAMVTLRLPSPDRGLLQRLGENPEDLLVVSGLLLEDAAELDVAVEPHPGTKCPRCWNRRGGAGKGEDLDLCPRCWDVVGAGAQG